MKKKTVDTALPELPEMNFLPQKVMRKVEKKQFLRHGIIVVGLVLILNALLYGYAQIPIAAAKHDVTQAQQQITQIKQRQQQYKDVRNENLNILLMKQLRVGVASLDVDWASYLNSVNGVAPAGASVTALTTTNNELTTSTDGSSTTASSSANGAAPTGVGTMTLTISTRTVQDASTWVNSIKGIKGVSDATVSTMSLSDANAAQNAGDYTNTVTVTLGPDALRSRFLEDLN